MLFLIEHMSFKNIFCPNVAWKVGALIIQIVYIIPQVCEGLSCDLTYINCSEAIFHFDINVSISDWRSSNIASLILKWLALKKVCKLKKMDQRSKHDFDSNYLHEK